MSFSKKVEGEGSPQMLGEENFAEKVFFSEKKKVAGNEVGSALGK